MGNERCIASPSLALIKYWGKKKTSANLPATPSLAVTLGGLETETQVYLGPKDYVLLDGRAQDPERFQPFFDHLRRSLKTDQHFQVRTRNNFPSAAGLASSSSGFAALTCAAARATGRTMSPEALSELARYGSASASRAVFGGFVLLPAGARRAQALLPAEHWPELRILVAVVSENAKPVSSRTAMALSRESSPYYRAWIRSSRKLIPEAVSALKRRDIEALGKMVRLSYSRMHAVMLASDPPLTYWVPRTLTVLQACEQLRKQGTGVWETMDAGPQVKILCLNADVPRIKRVLSEQNEGLRIIEAYPGPAPRFFSGERNEMLYA
jgi:diphosphomevalonate decarboxylase